MKPTNCISKKPSPFNALSTFVLMMPLLVMATGCRFSNEKSNSEALSAKPQYKENRYFVFWEGDFNGKDAQLIKSYTQDSIQGPGAAFYTNYGKKGNYAIEQIEKETYQAKTPLTYNPEMTKYPNNLIFQIDQIFSQGAKIHTVEAKCEKKNARVFLLDAEIDQSALYSALVMRVKGFDGLFRNEKAYCPAQEYSVTALGQDSDGVKKTFNFDLRPAIKSPKSTFFSHMEIKEKHDDSLLNITTLKIAEAPSTTFQLMGILELENPTSETMTLEFRPRRTGGVVNTRYTYSWPYGKAGIPHNSDGSTKPQPITYGADSLSKGEVYAIELTDRSEGAVSRQLVNSLLMGKKEMLKLTLPTGRKVKLIALYYQTIDNSEDLFQRYIVTGENQHDTAAGEVVHVGCIGQGDHGPGAHRCIDELRLNRGSHYWGMKFFIDPVREFADPTDLSGTTAIARYQDQDAGTDIASVEYEILPILSAITFGETYPRPGIDDRKTRSFYLFNGYYSHTEVNHGAWTVWYDYGLSSIIHP